MALYSTHTGAFRQTVKALNALDINTFNADVLEALAAQRDVAPEHREISDLVRHMAERGAQQHASVDKIAGELRQLISETHLKSFLKYYQLFVQQLLKKLERSAVVPNHLDDVQWRLQLELASETSEKILEPTALFHFNLCSANGSPTEEFALEFSHDELYEFFNQLEDVQEQLDSLS